MTRILKALESLPCPVHETDAAPRTPAPYVVWAEDMPGETLWADDRRQRAGKQGTIDLYTKRRRDPLREKVEEALNTGEISWYLNSVQYEDETGLMHWEWVWEVD